MRGATETSSLTEIRLRLSNLGYFLKHETNTHESELNRDGICSRRLLLHFFFFPTLLNLRDKAGPLMWFPGEIQRKDSLCKLHFA